MRAALERAAIAAAVWFVLAGAVAPALAAQSQPRWILEIEAGPVWQFYNDVEIPNDGSATRFSLRDLAGAGPWPATRLYLTWHPAERHGLRFLAAPLTVRATAVPAGPVTFAGEEYVAGSDVQATYTFNSYRLTYRYRLRDDDRWTGWIGFTAKIRDAVIGLEQGPTSSRKTDLGFVPLLHLAADWRLGGPWTVGIDVDAIAGGPGRAEDAAVRIGYDVADRWTLRAGYRLVEGGADVSEVYTFAGFHYGVVSVTWRVR
jgi:hypothetical protein